MDIIEWFSIQIQIVILKSNEQNKDYEKNIYFVAHSKDNNEWASSVWVTNVPMSLQ